MNRYILWLLLVILCCSSLHAQSRTANLNIAFSVPELTHIEIIQPTLTFNLAYGGPTGMIYQPREINANYSISCTGVNKKILAQLNQNMPNQMFLDLRVDPPTNATSAGYVTLNTTPQIVVSDISNVHEQSRLLFFRMRADLGAPTTPTMQHRTVTLTISD
jgi:hypothetical protein